MRSGRRPGRRAARRPAAGIPSWTPLAQDQYLEKRTLLAGYLLSSQGDRMLMAHSVEGRFPFLDANVIALANRCRTPTSCACSTRKHVLKSGGAGGAERDPRAQQAALTARRTRPQR